VNILVILIPAALVLGLIALLGFFWALRHNQFEDPSGQAARILSDRYDDHPAEDSAAPRRPPGQRPPRNPLDDPPDAS
jgi:cbb3-type cytochrome oxidase maturation protein